MRAASVVTICAGVLLMPLISRAAAADDKAEAAQAWTVPSNEAIRSILAKRMEHNGVGVVVGIIDPSGQRVVSYGTSGAADSRSLDGDTIFQIGSVSKTFVGLLFADMILHKEVKIDDPAQKYLPAGVMMPEKGRPITLVDLQTHMSGLPPMPTNFDLLGEPDPIEAYRVQDLYQFLATYKLPRAPGEKPEYSNLGVSLLGRLLAVSKGVEYEQLIKQRVLNPLGMTSTAINLTPEQQKRLAPGHDRDLKPVHTPEMKTLAPSGSLRSSANDLLKYLAANLGYKDTELKQAMLYQRTAARAPLSSAPLKRGWAEQSLGWRVRKDAGHEVFGHEGGKQGYRCSVLFDPTRRIGIVVLANARTDDEPYALAIHLLTGAPMAPAPPAISERKFSRIDSRVLDAYAGNYRLADEIIRVARRDDGLMIDSEGDGPVAFYPENARDFGTRAEDEQVTFDVDPSGVVKGLKWYPRGRSAGEHQNAVRTQ